MRLNTVDYRSTQADVRTVQDIDIEENLMTPARRAALDALEREFQELLKARPR